MNKRHFVIWMWCNLDIAIGVMALVLCMATMRQGRQLLDLSHLAAVPIPLSNAFYLALLLLAFTGIHHAFGLHYNMQGFSKTALASRILGATATGSLLFVLFPGVFPTFGTARQLGATFFAGAALASLVVRFSVRYFRMNLDPARRSSPRVLIVGSGPMASRLADSLVANRRAVNVLGFVDSPGTHQVNAETAAALLGGLEDLEALLMSTAVDEVMVALPLRSCYDRIQEVIRICERIGVPAAYSFQPFRHDLGYARLERWPAPYVHWRPSRDVESHPIKRILDFIVALGSLIFLLPVFVLIAAAIKISGPGPVFFVQERFGLNKRKFRMYKFRSMVPDAEARQSALETQNEAQGPVFKMHKDPRTTRLGFFLRKTSLDELPQLFNVLIGDMSLVGPRPLPVRDVERFSAGWLMRRFSVKPGLTCLWQVNGRSNTTFDEWITLDLKYIDNWSPLLDLKILAMTIPAVVRGSGAF